MDYRCCIFHWWDIGDLGSLSVYLDIMVVYQCIMGSEIDGNIGSVSVYVPHLFFIGGIYALKYRNHDVKKHHHIIIT